MKLNNYFIVKIFNITVFSAIFASSAYSADWTTWRGNISRTGVSEETITFPLNLTWNYTANQAPSPATIPSYLTAKKGGLGKELTKTFTSDNAYQIIAIGDNLYFSSSTEESVFCLDAKSGKVNWSFTTEGAVRFAPIYSNDKLFFGSDDGFVYCINAITGKKVWSFYTGKTDRRVILSNKIASQWPVRTGLIIKNDVLYVASGIFPASDRGVSLFALNAENGAVKYKKDLLVQAQGHLLIEDDKIIVPTGRTAPIAYDLKTGNLAKASYMTRRDEGGGSPLMVDDMLVYGPNEFGFLKIE